MILLGRCESKKKFLKTKIRKRLEIYTFSFLGVGGVLKLRQIMILQPMRDDRSFSYITNTEP